MKKFLKTFMCLSLVLILSLSMVACSDKKEETTDNKRGEKTQNNNTVIQVDDKIKTVVENYVKDYYKGVNSEVTLPDGVFLPGKDLIDDVASMKDEAKTNTIRTKIAEKSSVEFISNDVSEDNGKVEVKISFSYDMAMIQAAMDNVSKENQGDLTATEIISKCFDDIIKAIENPGDNPTVEQVQLKLELESKAVENKSDKDLTTSNDDKTNGEEQKDGKSWVITKIEK